jgi:hypothetical protein
LSLLAGGTLLAAAAAKVAGSDVSPVARSGWLAGSELLGMLVVYEFFVGGWLVSGLMKAGAWLAATATFVVFAAVSGRAAWIGQASCGCMGRLDTPPVYVLLLDLAMVIALLVSFPRSGDAPLFTRVRSDLVLAVRWTSGVAACVGLLLLGGAAYFGSLNEVMARLRGEEVSVTPAVVRLGEIRTGEKVTARLVVTNRGSSPIRLVGGTSDCSCVTTKELPMTVGPVDSVLVEIAVRAPAGPGQFVKHAWLLTDYEGMSAVPFEVTAAVKASP